MKQLKDLSETGPVRTQVAIVGSGPAGTEVATYLAASGHHVTILESGRDAFDERIQALSKAEFAGRQHRVYEEGAGFHEYLEPHYRGLNHLRQLGGTSCIWTGKWRAFEPRDFEKRSWIPQSGWPIGFEEMERHYAEVARDYGIGVGTGRSLDPAMEGHAESFRRAGFKVIPFFNQTKPYRAVERLRTGTSDRLDIVVDATVTRIDLAEGSDRVSGLVCRSIDGAERRVEADHVVLAAGGFETARLLLASNHQHSAGLGNGHDLVGRFYQDHLKVFRGKLLPGPLLLSHARSLQRCPDPHVTLCLGLPNEVQERLGVLEATLFFMPRYERKLERARSFLLRRRRIADDFGMVRAYKVKYALEQAVNRDSRVRLSNDRDALGVPRLVVDWQLTDLDQRSFDVSAVELVRLAKDTGLGALELGSTPADIDNAIDCAHHMGTTRMAATPREGVVDPNCTVFGLPNLHVASASAFSTGAGYSPTFTIVTLARRLAKHLDALLAPMRVRDGMTAGAEEAARPDHLAV